MVQEAGSGVNEDLVGVVNAVDEGMVDEATGERESIAEQER